MKPLEHVQGTLEVTAVAAANKATVTGSLMTMLGGVTSSDLGVWAGIVIGVCGLAVSWFFKAKADARYEEANRRYGEAHRAYMARLTTGRWVPEPPTPREEQET